MASVENGRKVVDIHGGVNRDLCSVLKQLIADGFSHAAVVMRSSEPASNIGVSAPVDRDACGLLWTSLREVIQRWGGQLIQADMLSRKAEQCYKLFDIFIK